MQESAALEPMDKAPAVVLPSSACMISALTVVLL